MGTLFQRHILLGVTAGIAACKGAALVRELRRAGAEVRVVMTPAATAFISPLTLQALSGHAVRVELMDAEAESGMDHIALARWAEAVLVAPASADFMARLTFGLANDLLTTLCLASEAPVALAPAMNRAMWAKPVTQENADRLRARGIHLFGPASGEQACGETGAGRMLEPAELVERVQALFPAGQLDGRRLLITAGPTREAIDPVRYIGNRSSGKMGFALARAAVEAGAEVVLVSGPVVLETPPGVRRLDVESAEQMLAAVEEALPGCDVFIATAAVADYRPLEVREEKIKKQGEGMTLRLERTPDILATVAARADAPFCVGFAAETHDVEHYARAKLEAKGLDLVAANRVGAGLAFGQDDNALHLFWSGGEQKLERADKLQLARRLIEVIAGRLADGTTSK